MVEEDALKMAILHLDGNEWWFHGLKTLGHDQVKTYGEFIDKVLERFEQKYPELSFKELAQLKQVGIRMSICRNSKDYQLRWPMYLWEG